MDALSQVIRCGAYFGLMRALLILAFQHRVGGCKPSDRYTEKVRKKPSQDIQVFKAKSGHPGLYTAFMKVMGVPAFPPAFTSSFYFSSPAIWQRCLYNPYFTPRFCRLL
jgi:hypothetical protein